jgi:hypothetical protein
VILAAFTADMVVTPFKAEARPLHHWHGLHTCPSESFEEGSRRMVVVTRALPDCDRAALGGAKQIDDLGDRGAFWRE